MNYKTHINGGILIGLCIGSKIQNISIISTVTFAGGALLGSLLPDIDHKNSYIGKKTKGISNAINKLAGHRKLFHAPLMYLLLYSMSTSITSNKLLLLGLKGLFLGILSHLVLDSFTVGGLPWFYPLSKKKLSFSKIKTNGRLESFLCGILICINIVLFLDLLHITSIFIFAQK